MRKEFKVICIKDFKPNEEFKGRLTKGKVYTAMESIIYGNTHYVILGDDTFANAHFYKENFEILRDHNIDNII